MYKFRRSLTTLKAAEGSPEYNFWRIYE